MGEFNKVTYLYGWCQKIIPLVYDDSLSYYEMLCKVREKLNEVITNTNMIPDMIKQEVQDFINSGQIEDMIGDILTGYLQQIVVNVVVPPQGITPAKGNGNDDTETFQQCIDYLAAKGGGLLFVPDGDWMVKPLTIKNGVYIAGASVSTKITLIGGSSAGLISGTVTDCGVSSLTLSNNAAQQTVDKAVIDITCNNITLNNLVVKNGYMGVKVTVNNGALIRGIKFDTLGYGGLYVNGSNADVSVSDVTVKNVSLVSGQFGVDNHCDRAVYNHIAVYGPMPTGFSNNGDFVSFDGRISNCDTGIFNVGDDCDFTALVSGNTEIINDTGARTSYNFKGQSSQIKIGKTLLNIGTSEPIMYKTPLPLENTTEFKYVPAQDYNGKPYKLLVLGEFTNKNDYVNPDDFGAIGDGITNDYQAISDAITAATSAGKYVKFSRDKSYYWDGPGINPTCDVDFNNCTLVMPDTDNSLFLTPEYDSTSYSKSFFTKYKTTSPDLIGKSFALRTRLSLGERQGGSGGTYYHTQYIVCDNEGNFTNGPIVAGYDQSSSFLCSFIQPSIQTPIVIKNVTLKYPNTNTLVSGLISCRRNNVHVKHVNITGQLKTHTNGAAAIADFQYCAMCSLTDVQGNSPSANTELACYIGSAVRCSNITFKNWFTTGGWGQTGLSFITNMTVEGCQLNRCDIHYGFCGYFTVKNTVLGGNAGYATIGYGYGNLIYDHVTFLSTEVYCATIRPDFGILPMADILFSGCSFYTANTATNTSAVYVPTLTALTNIADFGDKKFNIIFDGCNFNVRTPLNNFSDGTLSAYVCVTIKNCQLNSPVRYIMSTNKCNTVTVINVKQQNLFTDLLTSDCLSTLKIISSETFLGFGNAPSCDVFITGCTILRVDTSTITCNNIICTDNMVAVNQAPVITVNGQKCFNNNLIIASSTSNQAEWNTGIS